MAITYQGDYKAMVKTGPENEPIIIFELSDGEPIPDLKGEAINQHMSSFFLTSFKE
jgi:hypothetical protein